MFTVVFAVGTFLLTPLQAQHADFCKEGGGIVYSVEKDACVYHELEYGMRDDGYMGYVPTGRLETRTGAEIGQMLEPGC